MSALCREFGITRQTGYKWLKRFETEGVRGLEERTRKPHTTPLGTAEEMVIAIVDERQKRPRWGPTKLRAMLVARFGEEDVLPNLGPANCEVPGSLRTRSAFFFQAPSDDARGCRCT